MASADPEQWLDAHGDALFAYAMLRVRNQALAEDLVQDTLLAGITGITGLAGFGGKSSERTWLTGILKNRIVDHVRKSSREESYETDIEDGNEWYGQDHRLHRRPCRDPAHRRASRAARCKAGAIRHSIGTRATASCAAGPQ